MNMHPSSKSLRPQVLRRSKVVAESTQFCNYSHRVCMQMRLEGYDYCARHILEDKNSPFKQCQYVSNKTSKRCTSAALRTDKKEGYCPDHARRAAQLRFRAGRKRHPKETPELLLEELEHYTPRTSGNNSGSDSKKSRNSESTSAKIIEFMSSSDSEVEALTVENTWRGDGDSDAESVDSEQEDPLKHAGIYTAEEVALITRDKLIRLQSLYIDQFKRLQHVMKEKRRRYLHTVSKERELLGSIRCAKDDPRQRSKYDELVAMKRYHRRFGQEALLHRQSKERRIAVSEGINYKPPSYPKCVMSINFGRCGARTVPLSKYCLEHMIQDPHQMLYKECNYADQCKRAIVGIENEPSCGYHVTTEEIEYRLPKKDEKDDCKEDIDVVGGTDTKPEDPHQSLQLQLKLQQDQMKLDGAAGSLNNRELNIPSTTSSVPSASHGLTNAQETTAPSISTASTPLSMKLPTTYAPGTLQSTTTTLNLLGTQQKSTDEITSNKLNSQSKQAELTNSESGVLGNLSTQKDAVQGSTCSDPDNAPHSNKIKLDATANTPKSLGGTSGTGSTKTNETPKPVHSQLGLLQIATTKESSSSMLMLRPDETFEHRKSQEIVSPSRNNSKIFQETTTSTICRVPQERKTSLSSPGPILSPIPPKEVPQVVNDLLEMEKELDEVKQNQIFKRHEMVLNRPMAPGSSKSEMAVAFREYPLSAEGLNKPLLKPANVNDGKTQDDLENKDLKLKMVADKSMEKYGVDDDINMVDLTQSDDSLNVSMDTS